MANMLKGLGLCLVFMTLASICSDILSIYIDSYEYVVWFIFGGAYFDAIRKFKL